MKYARLSASLLLASAFLLTACGSEKMPDSVSDGMTMAQMETPETETTEAETTAPETTQPTVISLGEAITEIDGIPYAAYTGSFTVDSRDNEISVGDLILQRAAYAVSENIEIEAEYYISTDLISQYYADSLTWDSEICRFQHNHLAVTIADGMLTAEDAVFGVQHKHECRTFVYNDQLYIDWRDIADLLGLTGVWERCYTESVTHMVLLRHFIVKTMPKMEYRNTTHDGAVTEIYTYEGAEPVASISAEPFMISETGIYYYESDGIYYANFDGMFYPLEMTDYESRDVPQ